MAAAQKAARQLVLGTSRRAEFSRSVVSSFTRLEIAVQTSLEAPLFTLFTSGSSARAHTVATLEFLENEDAAEGGTCIPVSTGVVVINAVRGNDVIGQSYDVTQLVTKITERVDPKP